MYQESHSNEEWLSDLQVVSRWCPFRRSGILEANGISGSGGSPRNLALVDKGVVDYCQGQIPAAVVGHLRRWPGLAYVAPVFHTPVQVKGKLVFVRGVPLDNHVEVEGVEILRGMRELEG